MYHKQACYFDTCVYDTERKYFRHPMSQKDFDDNYDFPKQFRRDTDTLLFIKQGGDLYRQC